VEEFKRKRESFSKIIQDKGENSVDLGIFLVYLINIFLNYRLESSEDERIEQNSKRYKKNQTRMLEKELSGQLKIEKQEKKKKKKEKQLELRKKRIEKAKKNRMLI